MLFLQHHYANENPTQSFYFDDKTLITLLKIWLLELLSLFYCSSFFTNDMSLNCFWENPLCQKPWDVFPWDTPQGPAPVLSEVRADLMITFRPSYTGKTSFLSYPDCLHLWWKSMTGVQIECMGWLWGPVLCPRAVRFKMFLPLTSVKNKLCTLPPDSLSWRRGFTLIFLPLLINKESITQDLRPDAVAEKN